MKWYLPKHRTNQDTLGVEDIIEGGLLHVAEGGVEDVEMILIIVD